MRLTARFLTSIFLLVALPGSIFSSPVYANHEDKPLTQIVLDPITEFASSVFTGFSQVDNTLEESFGSALGVRRPASETTQNASLITHNQGLVLAETDVAPNTGFLGIIARFFQSLLSPLQDIQVNLASQGERGKVSPHTHPELSQGQSGEATTSIDSIASLQNDVEELEDRQDSQDSNISLLASRTLDLDLLVKATEKEYTKLTVSSSLTVAGTTDLSTTNITGVLKVGDTITSGGSITFDASSFVRIGDSSAPGHATGDTDLYVQGKLEVDSSVDLGTSLNVTGDASFGSKLTAANTSVTHTFGGITVTGNNIVIPGTTKIAGNTYTWPTTVTNGYALTTDGSGTLSWSQAGVNDAEYLTLATNSSLTAERVLTAGTGISFDDAGANGALTINYSGASSQWTSSGSNIYYNIGTGASYVGIGTSSPSYHLDVAGDANLTGSLRLDGNTFLSNAGTNNLMVGVSAGVNNSGSRVLFIGNYSGRTNSSGTDNLGIGISALYANATGNFNLAIGTNALQTNTSSVNIGIGASALLSNASGNNNIAIGYGAMYGNDSGTYNVAIGRDTLRGASGSGTLNIALGDSTLGATTSGARNVAIGKDSLTNNTTASNNSALGTYTLRANSTGTRNVAFGSGALVANTTASDNIGIGTSAGAANTTGTRGLFIGSYAGAANTTANDNFFLGYQSGFTNTTGTRNIALGSGTLMSTTTTNDNLGIGVSAGLLASGSTRGVFIGNYAGAVGTGNVDNLFIGYEAGKDTTGYRNLGIGTHALRANTSGIENIGIGVSALMVNTSGESNIALGYRSLSANTTGNYNLAIGYASLFANTTGATNSAFGYGTLSANTTGAMNIGLGMHALAANTTASDNLGIGVSAGRNNTTGTRGIFIGNQAGAANTTANDNLFVGYEAGLSTTTGTPNLAIGSHALRANTTGAHNIGIGNSALLVNTTGNSNIAIGSLVLKANTTGAQNVGVGLSVLFSNTTGNSNTAIGINSLRDTTTGSQNAAGGAFALRSNTTGGDNAAFGYGALFTSTTASGNTALGYFSLFANTTGTRNVAVGYKAGEANTTANDNLFIGYEAGLSNTTGTQSLSIGTHALRANTTGNDNIGIGHSAGLKTTTGSRAIFIGSYAGASNTTFSDNILIGYEAGTSAASGSQLLAIGSHALRANTTGDGNIGIGVSALMANTSGSYNFAIGEQALGKNTGGSFSTALGAFSLSANTGSSNVALGYASLNANTTGFQNTAIGTGSLIANTTGNNNTALGRYSLSANTTGSHNTALGLESLYSNTIGSNNIAMGANSLGVGSSLYNNVAVGVSAGISNNGSGNVFLGYQAGAGETGSDKLYIANSSSGNPLIYGDFSNGSVGIGVTTSAWGSGWLAAQLGSTLSLYDVSGGSSGFHKNAYHNGTDYIALTTAASSRAYFPLAGGFNIGVAPSVTAGSAQTFTDYFQIGSSGNVAVGTGSPVASTILLVNSPTTVTSGVSQRGINLLPTFSSAATTDGIGLQIEVNTAAASFTMASAYGIYVANAAKGAGSAITNNYGIWVAEQTAGGTGNYGVVVSGNPTYAFYQNGTNSVNFFGSGLRIGNNSEASGIWSASRGGSSSTLYIGNASINVTSDVRLKKDITPTDSTAIDLFKQLDVIDYAWNDPSDTAEVNRNSRGRWHLGVSAQQLMTVMPWLVNSPCPVTQQPADQPCDKEGYLQVDFAHGFGAFVKGFQETDARLLEIESKTDAIAPLVATVQTQQTEIDTLKDSILALQNDGVGVGSSGILNLQGLTVEGDISATGTVSAKGIRVTDTTGRAVIPAGATSVVVNAPAVTDVSNILVTPTNVTDKVLSATTRVAGTSFTVEIASPAASDIEFSWFLVN